MPMLPSLFLPLETSPLKWHCHVRLGRRCPPLIPVHVFTHTHTPHIHIHIAHTYTHTYTYTYTSPCIAHTYTHTYTYTHLHICTHIPTHYSTVFVNADQKTGFGTPWEVQFISNFTVLFKGGNVEGYSALLSYVPKLQLGTLMVYGTCPLGVKEMVQHVDVTCTCTWKGVLMPVGATSGT